MSSRLRRADEEKEKIDITLTYFTIKFLAYSERIHSYKHTMSMQDSLKGLYNTIGDLNIIYNLQP